MSKWIEKRTRPVLPLYLAALTWPVASLILPPYRLVNLVIIAALSTVVYLVSSRFCPTRVQRVEQPYATGSENTDAMLNGIAANLDALHKLNDAIPDAELSRQLDRMEKAGRGIVQAVEQKPDKARTVDRFARYYLPEGLRRQRPGRHRKKTLQVTAKPGCLPQDAWACPACQRARFCADLRVSLSGKIIEKANNFLL